MLHKNIPAGDIHIVPNWSVADATALNALTPVEADELKIAHRQDNNALYLLTDYTGPTWVAIGIGLTPGTHATTHVNGTDDIQSATAAQKGLATAAQITKLDGIEAAADVTDAANVAAAGALMESALGTGVETALGVNIGSAGAPVVLNGAGGTPSSLTLTNATGLPTGGIVDDAVTLAKMAHGTAGNLITFDAAGAPAAVATGTATHVLTSNGAGAAPTFQAAAGGAVATDAIWDAAGDIVQGTGANTAARLAIGTALQVLRVNAGATAVEWAAAAGNVATDAIWDAAGDLAVGTGANTAAKLTMGSALQVLRVNAGATALEYATPSSGGSLTLARWTALDGQPPAANWAQIDTRNSIAVLDFDAATDESIVFVGIMPEGAVLTGGVSVYLKWMATSATSGAVIWEASIERSNTDLDSDSFDTVAFASGTANGTSGIITSTTISFTTIDSVAAGELFRLKISRDANGTNGTDDMTGDAELVAVELRGVA
jgi:hypothetical protein